MFSFFVSTMEAILKLEDLYVEHHVKHGGYDHAKVGRCFCVCLVQAACVVDALGVRCIKSMSGAFYLVNKSATQLSCFLASGETKMSMEREEERYKKLDQGEWEGKQEVSEGKKRQARHDCYVKESSSHVPRWIGTLGRMQLWTRIKRRLRPKSTFSSESSSPSRRCNA